MMVHNNSHFPHLTSNFLLPTSHFIFFISSLIFAASSYLSSAIAFFNRANIWDRMCLQNKENTEEQQTMAENACMDYRMSLNLGLPPTISKQAMERIRILSSYYSTSVDPNPDFDLMQFLKSFKPESEDDDKT